MQKDDTLRVKGPVQREQGLVPTDEPHIGPLGQVEVELSRGRFTFIAKGDRQRGPVLGWEKKAIGAAS